MIDPKIIAALITEDPDVFLEGYQDTLHYYDDYKMGGSGNIGTLPLPQNVKHALIQSGFKLEDLLDDEFPVLIQDLGQQIGIDPTELQEIIKSALVDGIGLIPDWSKTQ